MFSVTIRTSRFPHNNDAQLYTQEPPLAFWSGITTIIKTFFSYFEHIPKHHQSNTDIDKDLNVIFLCVKNWKKSIDHQRAKNVYLAKIFNKRIEWNKAPPAKASFCAEYLKRNYASRLHRRGSKKVKSVTKDHFYLALRTRILDVR